MRNYFIGNVKVDGFNHKGWFVGHFIKNNRLGRTKDVEIKWDETKKGTKREEWSINNSAHTLTVVISGRLRVIFPDESFDLGSGEYFLSQPGTPHKYEILENGLTISVRWPSLPGDHSDRKVLDKKKTGI